MIITQLEGTVMPEHQITLQTAFNRVLEQVPSAIHSSYLAQDRSDKSIWRIVTVWKSREDLEAYRQSVETPAGVLMFREAGAEPVLSISEVVSHT
jgi:quinol monooxygenase YgiN